MPVLQAGNWGSLWVHWTETITTPRQPLLTNAENPHFPPPPPCMEWTKEDHSWTALIWGGVGGIVPWGNGATLNSTILCSSDPSWLFSGTYPMPKSHCCWLWFQGVCVMLPCKLGRPVWPEKGPRPPTEPVAAAAGRCFKARSPTQGTCLRSQNP